MFMALAEVVCLELSERWQLITRSVSVKLQSRPRLVGPHVFHFSLLFLAMFPLS